MHPHGNPNRDISRSRRRKAALRFEMILELVGTPSVRICATRWLCPQISDARFKPEQECSEIVIASVREAIQL
jgi:hypothetical protein